jgi:hypothetical protein
MEREEEEEEEKEEEEEYSDVGGREEIFNEVSLNKKVATTKGIPR